MEMTVSVMDSVDAMTSSIHDEIVFQATLQVPAHHAAMCRMEAYGSTPFAAAPALWDAPADHAQLTEDDLQFAACLAAPPDVEEAHSFSMPSTASILQRSAPSLRAASGMLTVSFSLRQRQSNRAKAGDDDPDQDRFPGLTGADSAGLAALGGAPADGQGAAGARSLMRRLSTAQARAGGGCAAVAEEDEDAAQAGAAPPGARLQGLLRIESITSRGRQREEVLLPLPGGSAGAAAGDGGGRQPSLVSRAVASMMGLGYIVLHTWQSRTAPHDTLLRTHIDAFAGRAPAGTMPAA